MRRRVKVWSDTGEVDFNPTWMPPDKYAQLPVLEDEDAYLAFVAAREAFDAAKAALTRCLASAEPLTAEETEDLKRDEVIG